MKAISILLILAVFSTSCTSLRPIQISRNQPINFATLADLITKGDVVKIRTTTGESYKFEVLTISEAGISGEEIELNYGDILAIEKVTWDIWKTSTAVGSLIGVLILIGLSQMPPPTG